MEINETGCCGLREISGLESEPKKCLVSICEQILNEEVSSYDPSEISNIRFGFILFTDGVGNKRGTKLAAYLKKNKLGVVTASPTRVNPNTKNKIKVWVWAIDIKALTKWAIKNIEKVDDEDDYWMN